jgi:hypothetical protein
MEAGLDWARWVDGERYECRERFVRVFRTAGAHGKLPPSSLAPVPACGSDTCQLAWATPTPYLWSLASSHQRDDLRAACATPSAHSVSYCRQNSFSDRPLSLKMATDSAEPSHTSCFGAL